MIPLPGFLLNNLSASSDIQYKHVSSLTLSLSLYSESLNFCSIKVNIIASFFIDFNKKNYLKFIFSKLYKLWKNNNTEIELLFNILYSF